MIMKKLNLQITSQCNMDCKFCSDLFKYQKEKSVDEILEVIEKLPRNSIENIVITGGEPLLYPELKSVLKGIKEKGFGVSLSTNGVLLEEKLDVLEYVDEITLPVDSGDSDILEEMGRDRLQLFITAKNISLLRDKYPNVKIKISTVLTRKNIDDLNSLSGIIEMLYLDEWEVHQFIPHGEGRYQIREFMIGDVVFNNAISYLETTNLAEKLTPISVREKLEDEWTITPCLTLVKLKDYDSVCFGKVVTMDSKRLSDLFKQKIYFR